MFLEFRKSTTPLEQPHRLTWLKEKQKMDKVGLKSVTWNLEKNICFLICSETHLSLEKNYLPVINY